MKVIKVVLSTLAVCFFLSTTVIADDRSDINQLITDFHQRSTNELLCLDAEWQLNREIGARFSEYFSAPFSQIYRQICTSVSLRFDPRYGDSPYISNNYDDFVQNRRKVSRLKLSPPQIKGSRATVRVTYDHGEGSFSRLGNFIHYNLIKERNNWRIDDIAIGGNDIRCDGLRCFSSLRKELEEMIIEESERRSSKKAKQ